MLQSQKKRGFSLVELMVVIGIVGILISLLYVNFNSARENTRDKLRQTNLSDLQLAIERYKAQTGQYPVAGCLGLPVVSGWVTSDTSIASGLLTTGQSNCSNFIIGLAPQFIPALPSSNEKYYYRSDGNSYKLLIFNAIEAEANKVKSYSTRFAACPGQCSGDGGICVISPTVVSTSYAVYSPGGACFN